MSRFISERYASLVPYVPGEQPQDRKYIKLNTNESPYPPAPAVIEAVGREEMADLRLYSDPECKVLRSKLASLYGLKPENVYLSNGSDDILSFAFMAYGADGRDVVFPAISYGFYQVFADLYGSRARKIPLKEDFSIDYRDYCDVHSTVVIANPNAPTGLALSVREIEEIVKSNSDNVVVIDEAYVDFGAESCLPLIHQYDNLLIVRTYSKSRAMAGARLGFALACEGLIDDLNRLKFSTNPYNINRLTLIAGAAAVDSNDYFVQNCHRIEKTRDMTACSLAELGFHVVPSKANFLFAKHDRLPGETVYRQLKERGVLVRHFLDSRISDYNRITIGSEEEMEILVSCLTDIVKKGETP